LNLAADSLLLAADTLSMTVTIIVVFLLTVRVMLTSLSTTVIRIAMALLELFELTDLIGRLFS
jgi:hypothetical protein